MNRVSDITKEVQTSVPVIPQIYAYTTPGIPDHDGWTKIGYTEQDVHKRIEQQTHTANVKYRLEWNGNAVYEGTEEVFHDTDFHAYLGKLGVKREPRTEWFNISAADSRKDFSEFRFNHGFVEERAVLPYRLRDEQRKAVEKTLNYARCHERGEFLWNAKPRFGKTLTAYDFCKRFDAKKILIVTNRPAIADSWYNDYCSFLGVESGYIFVSDNDLLKNKLGVMTRAQYRQHLLSSERSTDKCIEFVSLQDLKGSIYFGGDFDKLSEVAHLDWDVLIIDEAHEGVDTSKTELAFDQITRKFTLHLSGTPFKAIADAKFAEDAIFNWTYADEQEAKVNWDVSNEAENPYSDLPSLNLFTYQMSDVIEDKARKGIDLDGETFDYTADLNEFFATDDQGFFRHHDDVGRFLDAMTSQEKYPFSTPELRKELKHTFWVLNRVDSVKALAVMLKNHPVFKDYKVVIAAGDGKLDDSDSERTMKALDEVRDAIRDNDKTITLSVGQLTTGVTIPEWTAVLMLCNMKSPAAYMQAAFRAQNPCIIYDKEAGSQMRKRNAYVFDFDPARTLTIVEEFANDLYSDTAQGGGTSDDHKQNVRRLLNFLPVLGEDENGEMVELDAESVLSIPRKIHSREVVRHGFMSDYLFQNIGNVFHAPEVVVGIINSFEPTKKSTKGLGNVSEEADNANIGEDGEVDIPNEQVIGKAADVFGEKLYEDVTEDLTQQVDSSLEKAAKAPNNEVDELQKIAEKFGATLVAPLTETAKQYYGNDMKATQRERIERRIKTEVGSEIDRKVGNYKIQRNIIESNRKTALEQVETAEDTDRINAQNDAELQDAYVAFRNSLKEVAGKIVKETGKTIVKEVETAKREVTRTNLMDAIRDHLRGFSRTIPSFLMAYGDAKTTLKNFDSIIPANVFEEVTGISVEQFRLLRDGGDIQNDYGKTEHFDGHLFDEVVFDDSVQEFVGLKSKLANYFDENQTEDIFDYVPPQRTNQIFTPKKLVKHMVDLFEQENPDCFDDPEHTFADLYMKSGLFITEIVKRLYNNPNMKRLYPDDDARLRHIFEHQVYGIAPTEIIYKIATNFILGPNNEIGKNYKTHFVMADSAKLAQEGKLDEFVESVF
jgi:hypothetical protein